MVFETRSDIQSLAIPLILEGELLGCSKYRYRETAGLYLPAIESIIVIMLNFIGIGIKSNT